MGRSLWSLDGRKAGVPFIALLFCLSFSSPRPAHAASQETIPVDHWLYTLIDNLQARGYFGDLFLATRPYTRGEVAEYALEVMEEDNLTAAEKIWTERILGELDHEVQLMRDGQHSDEENFSWRIDLHGGTRGDIKEDNKELYPPYESVKFSGPADPDLVIWGESGGAIQYGERFIVVDRFQVDSDPVNNPSFRHRENRFRDRRYTFSQAYLAGKTGPASFEFGRDNVVWGHGSDRSLMISGISPPFDLLTYKVNVRTVRATGLFSFLDKTPGEDGTFSRFLYGHRIDWRALPWLQVGISETAVVTGIDRGIEFRYLNPLLFWPLVQREEVGQVDTDAYSSIDWSVYMPPGIFFYGELVADDLYLDRMEGNDNYPNQLAFHGGIVWGHRPLPDGLSLKLEYTRIGSFVYLHRGEATYYSHYDAPIGNPLGPDTDQWRAGLSYPLLENAEVGVQYVARRRGENRLEPAISARGHRGDPFPTGVVEKRKGLDVSLEWLLSDSFLFRGHFAYARISNLNNQIGEEDSIPNLELSLVYFLEYKGTLLSF